MSIDWTKPIQTKSGQPARLLGTYHPIVSGETHCVAITLGDGPAEYIKTYWANGNYCRNGTSTSDLENIPEPPKYRPYTNEEMASLVGKILIHGCSSMRSMVTSYASGDVWIVDAWKNAHQLLEGWRHEDGTPCGVLENV